MAPRVEIVEDHTAEFVAVAHLRGWCHDSRECPICKAAGARSHLKDGAALIAAERQRQVSEERRSPRHDDEHRGGELATAAACYALARHVRAARYVMSLWPWHSDWWKPCPDDRVRELVKAGALLAAEIDRLRRAR